MATLTANDKYPLSMRVLHWLIAVLIIGLLTVGLVMTSLPHNDPSRGTLYSLHKSFGVTLLFLAFLRSGLRLTHAIPPLPDAIPKIERILAQMGHWALYGFMFAMPVSGYLMSTYYGKPVQWFGIALPRLVGVDKELGAFFSDFHTFAAYALIGLLVLHVGAVVLHYARQRVNLLRRMW